MRPTGPQQIPSRRIPCHVRHADPRRLSRRQRVRTPAATGAVNSAVRSGTIRAVPPAVSHAPVTARGGDRHGARARASGARRGVGPSSSACRAGRGGVHRQGSGGTQGEGHETNCGADRIRALPSRRLFVSSLFVHRLLVDVRVAINHTQLRGSQQSELCGRLERHRQVHAIDRLIRSNDAHPRDPERRILRQASLDPHQLAVIPRQQHLPRD